MPATNTKRRKYSKKSPSWRSGWFTKHRLIAAIVALLAVSALVGAEARGLIVGPNKVPKNIGWIIDGNQLQDLIDYAPSALPKNFFSTSRTIVLQNGIDESSDIPVGWHSQAGNHYTSYESIKCDSGCYSLQADLADKTAAVNQRRTPKPLALFDDEAWFRTPNDEQNNPCGAMSQFVRTAQTHGLTTIVAPDQDLAEPGLLTSYQGGETENWQTYLRLGLGSCAAQSGANVYHIMSQPFEAHWCGNPLGECQSSESDFVNFVTQAALQAKAINPNIKISDGLSTSPLYFGYFRGSDIIAQVMYRDYADVLRVVNDVWLNIVGTNANTTALYFLSTVGENRPADRRSSVMFLQAKQLLGDSQPTSNQTEKLALNKGNSLTLVSKQSLPGGTVVPAGTGEFQFWTDGLPNQYAGLEVNFGYCTSDGCRQQTPIAKLDVNINGDGKGAVLPDGAYTTQIDTTLPMNGSYQLYIHMTARNSAPFSLLYGSESDPTNLSTTVLLPLK